jgi:hypothetical protein
MLVHLMTRELSKLGATTDYATDAHLYAYEAVYTNMHALQRRTPLGNGGCYWAWRRQVISQCRTNRINCCEIIACVRWCWCGAYTCSVRGAGLPTPRCHGLDLRKWHTCTPQNTWTMGHACDRTRHLTPTLPQCVHLFIDTWWNDDNGHVEWTFICSYMHSKIFPRTYSWQGLHVAGIVDPCGFEPKITLHFWFPLTRIILIWV